MDGFVERLAAARIGRTYNQYAGSELRRRRLAAYLDARECARWLVVGEAAGFRGARVSGLAFTSERQLSGTGPAEASASVVHRALADLDLEDDVLLWNVVPTHPGTEGSNRRPTTSEIATGLVFIGELAEGRAVIPVGRVAERALGAPGIRHPSHGGATAFREGLAARILLQSAAGGRRVRPLSVR